MRFWTHNLNFSFARKICNCKFSFVLLDKFTLTRALLLVWVYNVNVYLFSQREPLQSFKFRVACGLSLKRKLRRVFISNIKCEYVIVSNYSRRALMWRSCIKGLRFSDICLRTKSLYTDIWLNWSIYEKSAVLIFWNKLLNW